MHLENTTSSRQDQHKILSLCSAMIRPSKPMIVKVRVSRGHGYHVLYVPTLFFDLFLPVAYTSCDPKVYGSFRFFK